MGEPGSYQVNDRRRVIASHRPTRAECGLPETGVIFSNFNACYKLTPETFQLWMRILAATPGSVLWLLENNPIASANLRAAAHALGVDTARVVFAPPLPLEQHLARLSLADLLLDSLPANAHTTASDALWAGVPVLTLRGSAFSGRVAASLLESVGLPELVTETGAEYEALALRLASDAGELDAIRSRLADNRATASLFDSDRFRRNIETAYRQMWSIHRGGGKPRSFAVEE